MRRQKPFGQRDLGALEDGAHGHGVRLLAVTALQEAGASGLAPEAGRGVRATVRANRTVRPPDLLKVLSGGVFVGVDRVGEVAHG